MCPPDSSLTLRMTGRDIQKNIKDKRKSIIISGRFEIPKRHIKKSENIKKEKNFCFVSYFSGKIFNYG